MAKNKWYAPGTGTKKSPANIKVALYFYAECPRCSATVDSDQDDEQATCSQCGYKFYVNFDLQKCGL